MQVSVVSPSFDVPVASASPPPQDALELGLALMEVHDERNCSKFLYHYDQLLKHIVSCPAVHAPQWAWTAEHKTMKHNNYQHL